MSGCLVQYEHAVDSFQEAERLDPDFAMAYWGEAMTHTHALWNQTSPKTRVRLGKLAATPEARAAKAATAREKGHLTRPKVFGPARRARHRLPPGDGRDVEGVPGR
jgi:hypothetical protein